MYLINCFMLLTVGFLFAYVAVCALLLSFGRMCGVKNRPQKAACVSVFLVKL